MPFVYVRALRAGMPATLIRSSRTRIGQPAHAAVSDRSDGKPAIALTEPTAMAGRVHSLHRTTIVEAILIILDDSRDGVKRIAAIRILCRVLQIKILNRNVVVTELEIAANRFEVRFLHFLTHTFFIAEIAFDSCNR